MEQEKTAQEVEKLKALREEEALSKNSTKEELIPIDPQVAAEYAVMIKAGQLCRASNMEIGELTSALEEAKQQGLENRRDFFKKQQSLRTSLDNVYGSNAMISPDGQSIVFQKAESNVQNDN